MSGVLRRSAVLVAALAWPAPAMAAKIACVGDSITFGYGLSDRNVESYPARLQGLLGSAHTVQNFGVGSTTVLKSGDHPYWAEPSFKASDDFAPEVVIVMLGTNDAKPQNWSRKDDFSKDYRDLVQHYRALGALVYVTTPPPAYASGAFDISPDVVANGVIPLVRAVSTGVSAPLIDVFTALSGKPENFPDTVHPNAAGAELIAKTVHSALQASGFSAGGAAGGAPPGPVSDAGGCAVRAGAGKCSSWCAALVGGLGLLAVQVRRRTRRRGSHSARRGSHSARRGLRDCARYG